jgi:tetratricopeptide (TPR) repeat protein
VSFLIAQFIVKTMHQLKYRKIVLGFFALFMVIFSVLAYQRTMVWKDSISLWNDAIRKDNKGARQYKCRGDAYRELKQYDSAIKDYNAAVGLNNFDADAYFNRGMCYQDLFNATKDTVQLQKAVKSYELAVNYKNNEASFHNALGLAYYFAKNYTKSIESFSRALVLRPDDNEVYNNRIGPYLYTGQYENALKDAVRARDLGYPIDPAFIKSLTEKVNTLK